MKKLLIIEDDDTFSAGLVRALSRRGYVCTIAESIASARELCHSFQPEKVLLDLNLGGNLTQDFILELRQILPNVTLVVLTGYGTIPSAVQAIKDGADAYLTKPATVDSIEKALQSPLSSQAAPSLWDVENDHILKVLNECGGNITQTAQRLGLHRRTLQRKLKKIDLP